MAESMVINVAVDSILAKLLDDFAKRSPTQRRELAAEFGWAARRWAERTLDEAHGIDG